MKFAKIVFWVAAIWGLLVLTPLFFIFDLIGRQDPPPVTHPGFYYGFVTVGLAFQFIFAVIATDPVRFRPIMIPAVFEKFSVPAHFASILSRSDIFGQNETNATCFCHRAVAMECGRSRPERALAGKEGQRLVRQTALAGGKRLHSRKRDQ